MSKTYTRHAASGAFRDHSPEEYADLVASMREHGFDASKPIIAVGNEIICGWHRYRAALEAGIEPQVEEYATLSPEAIHDLVFRDELARRHMTPGERAEAVTRLRNLSTTMGHSTGLIREQCPVW